MRLGQYPEGYDSKIHGPYDPARYYGKPDTPFGEVVLKDLPEWIARRNAHPQAMTGAISRAFWRWQHKYIHPKKAGIAPFFHVVLISGAIFYVLNYHKIRREKLYQYHW